MNIVDNVCLPGKREELESLQTEAVARYEQAKRTQEMVRENHEKEVKVSKGTAAAVSAGASHPRRKKGL